jgi:hypothetical protein
VRREDGVEFARSKCRFGDMGGRVGQSGPEHEMENCNSRSKISNPFHDALNFSLLHSLISHLGIV